MNFFGIIFLYLFFIGEIRASLFSNIVRGIFTTNRFSRLVDDLPSYFIKSLENDEDDAGTFICQLRAGSVPQAFSGVATEVLDEAESDISTLVTVVENLPDLAEDLWNDIQNGAIDVVSVISNLVENPEGEITAIIGGVETVVQSVWGDITSGWNDFTHGVDCFFDPNNPRCQPQSTVNGVELDFSRLCQEYLLYPVTVTASMGIMTTDFEPVTTATPVQTYTPIVSTGVDVYDTPISTSESSNVPVQSDTPIPSTSVDNGDTLLTTVESTPTFVASNTSMSPVMPATLEQTSTSLQTYSPTLVLVPTSNILTTNKPTKPTNPLQTATTSVNVAGSAMGSDALLSSTVLMTHIMFLTVIFLVL